MFFSRSYSTSLVIDFGSTSIGVALVVQPISKKGNKTIPRIIFSHREWTLSAKKPESAQFLTGMVTLLDSALEQVQKNGIPILKKIAHRSSIDSVNCVYSSPWYIAQSRQITINNDREIEFTEKVLNALVFEEEHKLQKEKGELKIIDKKVTHIRLNGYDTALPYGKFAKQIGATIYLCLLETRVIKSVEAAMRKRINTHAITHHSFSLAAYNAIRSYFPQENFLILDIGGEVTDINVVKDGSLRYEVSFPYGKNYILRYIGYKKGLEPGMALSNVKIALNDTSSAPHLEEIDVHLKSVKRQWATEFQNALTKIENNFIPKNIFVTCDPDVLPFFTDILLKKELSQGMLMIEPFVVEALTPDLFANVVEIGPQVKEDVFLSINVFFVSSINYK